MQNIGEVIERIVFNLPSRLNFVNNYKNKKLKRGNKRKNIVKTTGNFKPYTWFQLSNQTFPQLLKTISQKILDFTDLSKLLC